MATKVQASLKSASEDKNDDTITKSVPTFLLDPRTLVVQEGFNARPLDPEHVAYFKELRRAGVDTGFITVQMVEGKRIIREGHHRHAAALALIEEGVDVQKVKCIEFKGDEKQAIFLMLSTQSGKQYTPLQIGEQYVKLVNTFGMSYNEIAAHRGMSAQHVKDMIRLTEQPAELKAMINSGEVKAATALKLVKKEGAAEATKTLKAASAAGVKAGKPITQKVLDNLGKNVVEKYRGQREAAGAHLAAMLESPGFDAHTKSVLTSVATLVAGKTERIPAAQVDSVGIVRDWLESIKDHTHTSVKQAAHLLHDLIDPKKKIPDDNSGAAQYYAHMIWLQDMAAKSTVPTFRAASHWFIAVLEAHRTGRELAPAPSVLSFEEAMRAEMESGGAVRAETLCPEQAELIAWARGRG